MSETNIDSIIDEAILAAEAAASQRLSQNGMGLPPIAAETINPDVILDRQPFRMERKETGMNFAAPTPIAEPAFVSDGFSVDDDDEGRAIFPFDVFFLPATPTKPNRSGIAYGLLIEQGDDMRNPEVHVPAKFAANNFGGIVELLWVGKVWLQWVVDDTAIREVKVVGPDEPLLIPYDPSVPLVGLQQYGYYIQIGETSDVEDETHNLWNGHHFIASYPDTGGADFNHMWKVTSSGPAGGVSPNATYSVAGGVAVIQGTRVPVAAKPNLAASGGTGFVVLKVTRNSASRVYDPGNIPVIEFYTTVPPSTYAAEYTVLAETLAVTVPAVIPGDPPTYRHDITQCRSDEICSYELLIVANGEFALLPVQANSRNSYAPPLP